jgi:hypothetical protein
MNTDSNTTASQGSGVISTTNVITDCNRPKEMSLANCLDNFDDNTRTLLRIKDVSIIIIDKLIGIDKILNGSNEPDIKTDINVRTPIIDAYYCVADKQGYLMSNILDNLNNILEAILHRVNE